MCISLNVALFRTVDVLVLQTHAWLQSLFSRINLTLAVGKKLLIDGVLELVNRGGHFSYGVRSNRTTITKNFLKLLFVSESLVFLQCKSDSICAYNIGFCITAVTAVTQSLLMRTH